MRNEVVLTNPGMQFKKGISGNPGTQFKKGISGNPGTQFKKGVAPNPMGNSIKLRQWRVIKKVMLNSAVTQQEIESLQGLKS